MYISILLMLSGVTEDDEMAAGREVFFLRSLRQFWSGSNTVGMHVQWFSDNLFLQITYVQPLPRLYPAHTMRSDRKRQKDSREGDVPSSKYAEDIL